MELEHKITTPGGNLDPDLLIRQALEAGLADEAGEAIEDLIATDPGHHEGWFLQGVRGLLLGHCAEAADSFAHALARGADPRQAGLGRAMALLRAERPTDAWTSLTDLLEDEPGDHEILHWLIRTGIALERWDDLAEHLESHLSLRSDDHAARFAYAGVSLRLGRPAIARAQYDRLRAEAADLVGLDDLGDILEPETLAASAA